MQPSFDDIPDDDPGWYSSAEYQSALIALGERLSDKQRRMLIAHALAPDLILTVRQLAAAAGYEQPNVTYSQYGRLGHALAEALEHGEDEVVWTRLIGWDSRAENGEVMWEMEPALARALINLGWVTRGGSANTLRLIDEVRRELEETGETEREALILARLGQGRFRTTLLRLHGACMISGVSEPAALRASHIKPWHVATNPERLNAANGLLLSATYDALFDVGLISFDDRGHVLVSSDLAPTDRVGLGITGAEHLRFLSDETRHFLQYHRNHVFRCRAAAV